MAYVLHFSRQNVSLTSGVNFLLLSYRRGVEYAPKKEQNLGSQHYDIIITLRGATTVETRLSDLNLGVFNFTRSFE